MAISGTSTTRDPAVMLSAAQIVDAQCSIIENCLKSIITDATSLKSEWEGESANIYQAAISKISEKSPTIVNIFKDYSSILRDDAIGFMNTDGGLSTTNEALPSSAWSE